MGKKENQKEMCKQFHMKMTQKEFDAFNELVANRGISATAFVKNRIFSNESYVIYNREVEKAIHSISNVLLVDVKEHCNDKEFIQKCQKEVEKLWLYLR